jgi:hypothetical protein
MNQRYVSIAAVSLAALVIGIGPAAAQTSPNDSPSTPGGRADTIGPGITGMGSGSADTGVNDNGAVNDESSSAGPRGDDESPSASPRGDINDESPSASPRGDDDATSRSSKGDESDRQQMKDRERQIDRNTDLDRADSRK